jgi:hypothetical protein
MPAVADATGSADARATHHAASNWLDHYPASAACPNAESII